MIFLIDKSFLLDIVRTVDALPLDWLLVLRLYSFAPVILNLCLCHGLLSIISPSSVRPSFAFHIFGISSRTASPIKLKLGGWHWGNMETQNCKNMFVWISRMAAMTTILKSFKLQLLPTRKLNWAETWWKASGQHGDSDLLNSFCSNIKNGRHDGHLEIL